MNHHEDDAPDYTQDERFFTYYTLEVARTVRMPEVVTYAERRNIQLPQALAELINKGLSHATTDD